MVLTGLLGEEAARITEFHRMILQSNSQHKLDDKALLLFHPSAERIYNSDPHHWVFHLTQHNKYNDDRSADLEEDYLSVLPTPTLAKSN